MTAYLVSLVIKLLTYAIVLATPSIDPVYNTGVRNLQIHLLFKFVPFFSASCFPIFLYVFADATGKGSAIMSPFHQIFSHDFYIDQHFLSV